MVIEYMCLDVGVCVDTRTRVFGDTGSCMYVHALAILVHMCAYVCLCVRILEHVCFCTHSLSLVYVLVCFARVCR